VLAHELYSAFARQKYKTSLYSLDGQYASNPRSRKVAGAEIAVVDTPGTLADKWKDIIEGSDVIVVPTRPTPNDVEPFTRTVHLIRKVTNAPILVVVNGHNRFRMAASFMAWLGTKDWAQHVCTVPQSEAVVQAEGEGKSVCDLAPRGNAAVTIENMVSEAARLAGIKYPK
jgi:chromosome partitioning protein